MIEQLRDKELINQLQELPADYINRVIEYQKVPLEDRKHHTCISFINFIVIGEGLPFFNPKIWNKIKFNKDNLKTGSVLVFLPKVGSDEINHCAMSIAENNFLSKIHGTDEIVITDLLDIVEYYEDTKAIEILEYNPKLT